MPASRAHLARNGRRDGRPSDASPRTISCLFLAALVASQSELALHSASQVAHTTLYQSHVRSALIRPHCAAVQPVHSTSSQHELTAQAHSTGSQHGLTARAHSTGAAHGRSAQHGRSARAHSTGAQHGRTARAHSTGAQHGRTARAHSTGAQHGRTAWAHSTGAQHGGAQHGRTARAHSTSAQHELTARVSMRVIPDQQEHMHHWQSQPSFVRQLME